MHTNITKSNIAVKPRIQYLYIIISSSKNIGYIGIQYGKNAHPDNLMTNYFTSSPEMQNFIKTYRDEIDIVGTLPFSDHTNLREIEKQIQHYAMVNYNHIKWLHKLSHQIYDKKYNLNGQLYTATQLGKLYGFDATRIHERIEILHYSVEEAVGLIHRQPGKRYEYNNQWLTLTQISNLENVDYQRLVNGLTKFNNIYDAVKFSKDLSEAYFIINDQSYSRIDLMIMCATSGKSFQDIYDGLSYGRSPLEVMTIPKGKHAKKFSENHDLNSILKDLQEKNKKAITETIANPLFHRAKHSRQKERE